MLHHCPLGLSVVTAFSQSSAWVRKLSEAVVLSNGDPLVKRIKSEVPNLRINACYLDDGTLCGSPSGLAAALKIIEEEGPPQGLCLNQAKSLLYIPADNVGTTNLPCEIPTMSESIVFLGNPIRPPSFGEAAVPNRVEKAKAVLTKLQDLEDSHMEASLLRSCLALPKVSFSLRTCPREALSDLAGSPVSDGLG